ncbi:MAG: hypothetical protein IJI68_11645 [Eggerthellaceae bacterium]|nr:hypothetical protein [Eggerthellaceae bacterium]
MQIGITIPLREFLKWKPFPPNCEEPLIFCWDAHRIKVDGRVMLVVCNAANRFAGVTAMRGNDWKRLGETCVELVRTSMTECGFSPSAVEEYLIRAGAVEFGRTHGRKAVGCMNRMIDTLLWSQCDHDEQFQAYLTHIVNEQDLGSCAAHEGQGYATERMAQDLSAMGIDPYGMPPDALDDEFSDTDIDQDVTPEDNALEDIAREVDAIIAAMDAEAANASPEAQEAAQNLAKQIASIARAMRIERGHDPACPPVEGVACTVCGTNPRVFLGAIPYCLNCYNELTERLMGAPHVTNDASVLAVFGKDGDMLQFGVERMLTPPFARWAAHEVVEDDDPRHDTGYVGIEVCIDANVAEDQEETLAKLWEKAQEAVSRPSTYVHEHSGRISNGAHVGDKVHFAANSGWGRIIEDEHGHYSIIIDGQRYDAEQFLGLFTGYTGFNLYWQIHDRGDDLPEPWEITESYKRRGLM